MAEISELQINELRLSCPILFSKVDYMPTKFIALTIKFELNTERVNQTDQIQDTACFLTLKDRISTYSAGLKEPIYIWEYGQKIVEIIKAITSKETPAKIEIEVFEKRSLVKSIFYIVEHNPDKTKASLHLKHVECMAKVGCVESEKKAPQRLLLDLLVQFPDHQWGAIDVDVSGLIMDVQDFLAHSYYNTLECLTNKLADYIEQSYCFTNIQLELQKTSESPGLFSAGVKLKRDTFHHRQLNAIYLSANSKHTAYLSIGSNLGDRLQNIHQALRLLSEHCSIVDTSFLYSTKYQGAFADTYPDFLNCAVKIETEWSALELLTQLKAIEKSLHRVKSTDHDNRTIDLDIVFYDNQVIHSQTLVIPHPRMHLREFVLRPLTDINPHFIHPIFKNSVADLLIKHISSLRPDIAKPYRLDQLPFSEVKRVTGIGSGIHDGSETLLMGILNVTPDSFSDGHKYYNNVNKAVDHALNMLKDGATVIDIGGVSTRPGAEPVSTEEEFSRVIPVVEQIIRELPHACLSIDTTNPYIAEECLKRGVCMVNDVSGLNQNVALYKVAAKYQVPIVLMHTKGNPKTMMDMAKTYGQEGYVECIAQEMGKIINTALKAGIYRWNIIIDPGIGFAKEAQQNVKLIYACHKTSPFVDYPCLVGHSRKSFIPKLDVIPKPNFRCDHHENLWGTLAVSAILAYNQAFMLRVHDVKENALIVKMANIIKHGDLPKD